MSATGLEPCSCGAAPLTWHQPGCDHARCPDCGEQQIACFDHDDRPALWHGIDQRAEVAAKLGWWTTAAGIDHLVADYTRVLYAIALHQVAWNLASQRYDIGPVDEAALDKTMRENR